MTCKDCYHCEACENRFAGLKKICVDEPVKHLELNPAVEKCCENFKDKSRIIELPCKVGETLYCVSYYNDNIQPFVKAYKNINLVNMLTLMTALENPASRIVLLTGNKNEAEAKLKENKQ